MNGWRIALLLELVDDGTSLVFLDETDSGVEKQQTADDTKIDPVLKTSSHCRRKVLAPLFTPPSIGWPPVGLAAQHQRPSAACEEGGLGHPQCSLTAFGGET